MYKIEIGIFEGPAYEHYYYDEDTQDVFRKKRIYNRPFKAVFSEQLEDDQAAEKMRCLLGGDSISKLSNDKILTTFVHTSEDPKTFIMSDYHGYRLTKIED